MITINTDLLHSKALWLGILPTVISYLGWSLKRLHKKVDRAVGKEEVEQLIKLHYLAMSTNLLHANNKLDRLLVKNERT